MASLEVWTDVHRSWPATRPPEIRIRGPASSRMRPRPPAPPPIEDVDEPPAVLELKAIAPPARGGAHVGVLPLQLVVVPPTTRRILRPAWPMRSPPRSPGFAGCSWCPRPRSPASPRKRAMKRRSGAPLVSISCWMEQSSRRTRLRITLASARSAGRQSGRGAAASIARRTICCRCRMRSPPRSLARSTGNPAHRVERIAARPPVDATAYDLVLRALSLIGRMERQPFMRAGELLSQAAARPRGGFASRALLRGALQGPPQLKAQLRSPN